MSTSCSYSIIAEPCDVPFIPGVEQDGPPLLMPVLVGHQVALFEGAILKEAKMINLENTHRTLNMITHFIFYECMITKDSVFKVFFFKPKLDYSDMFRRTSLRSR